MRRTIYFILTLSSIITLSHCRQSYTTKGRILPRIEYRLEIHPRGDNSIRVYILAADCVPESVEWVDLLLQSFAVSHRHALDIDRLLVIIARHPYGGESYEIPASLYRKYLLEEISLSELFAGITTRDLEPISESFF